MFTKNNGMVGDERLDVSLEINSLTNKVRKLSRIDSKRGICAPFAPLARIQQRGEVR